MEIRRLKSIEELFAIAGDDALVHCNVPAAEADRGVAWAGPDGTLAFGGADDVVPDRVNWLTVIGPADTATALAAVALDALPMRPHGISMPREARLDGYALTEAEEWDFMAWTGTDLPTQPGEERVEALLPGPEADAEIAEFLTKANPHHSAKPGWEAIEVWATVRDPADAALTACGAFCRPGLTTRPYLASIGTSPAARGQGLGAAVSAWLTRRALEAGDPYCSLGHYVPNEPARRIYARLGYRTIHRMRSGRLVAAADGAAV